MSKQKKRPPLEPLKLTSNLLPCPWCGAIPTMQPWHGGGPNKQCIYCEGDDCAVNPRVTGETPDEAAAHWNTRVK